MKLLKKASSIFDSTLTGTAILAAVILVGIMVLVCVEVVMRYFLHQPLSWVHEIGEYSLLYMLFLGTAWLLKREGHIKMDLVLNQLKPTAQAMINIISSIILAFFSLVVTWYGFALTWENFQAGNYDVSILEIPLGAVLIIIPIGTFLLFIQFLRRSYDYLVRWRASQ